MSSLNNRPPSYTPKTSPPSHTFARNIAGVAARCTRLAVAMAQRIALTSRNRSSSANCAAFMQLSMASNRVSSTHGFCCATRASSRRQFHYETGATQLYCFGTQYSLARRPHVDPLAKLLILSLFPER